ncbi:MAG: sigma-70 family RNA polymerase sigma factor [Planctomycetota bacterium]|nr:sigma-70 family RNA polymerase sigma factor [Planctomycetota bacterium]MDA1249471.1 sigma-70 family RNA polymerase sigma factor [Planctomycetota bacterium]
MAGLDGTSNSTPELTRTDHQKSPQNGARSPCAVNSAEIGSAEDIDRLPERLANGDETALEQILREFGPPVRGLLARKYCGVLGEGDFEDVLSIALFRVWQHRERFDPTRASLKAWFYRIATNAARDVLRYGWYKARRLEVSYEAASLASVRTMEAAEAFSQKEQSGENDSADVENPEHEEVRQLLREVLATLSDAQRRIVLADAASKEGKVPSQELSDELGIPPATIRVYRRRAIEKLRKELDRRGLKRESENE